MAEEDLIFGKNRHFFGGVEPSNMIEFSASYDATGPVSRSKVVAKLPADTTIDGQTLCSVAGAVIRKKIGVYPKDEFDGTLVKIISTDETFYDEDVEIDNTYYYAAFPFTTQGVYNRNIANRSICTINARYEPDDMKAFTAASVYSNGRARVRLNATLPDNGTAERPYTIAGAMIRRSTTGYPTSETEGVLVKDLKASEEFYDINVTLDQTYYYAAFPYTTQGVYNRNVANRTTCKPTPIIPGNMQAFTVKSVRVNGKPRVKITATLPANSTECTIAGAVIRRSTTGYPVNRSDGSQVMTITANGTFYDANVTVGTTYYYTAFPYSTYGVYNSNSVNRASCEVLAREYLYGYDLVTATPEPAARVSYPSDVDNAGFTPAAMNFTSGVFNYGSWPNTPGEKFMPQPCMLTFAGVVDHYLNPNDYTEKTNGDASKVADISFGGNAMMEWPKIYTKRWEENGVYHFRCSDAKIDDDYECWCNYDRNNNEIDNFYTPIYFGSKDSSNRLRSISGQSNIVSRYATQEIEYAAANGDDWYTEVLADRLLIQDLLVMMAKSTDCQTAFGNGICESKAYIGQGTMNTKGLFWGSDDNTSGVKVFGMENWWGNLGRRTAGYILDNGTQRVKLTRGTKDGSTAVDYNVDGSGYILVPNATPSGSTYGYITCMRTEKYGRLPVTTNGSSTTYECDQLRYKKSDTGYATLGGFAGPGRAIGPFFTELNTDVSIASGATGAALSCKPLAIV